MQKGDYNFEKWQPIIDFVGVTDPEKRIWLTNYLQGLEDNGNNVFDVEQFEASCRRNNHQCNNILNNTDSL